MKSQFSIFYLAVVLLTAAVAAAENAPREDGTKSVLCVVHRTEAKFVGVAYNHLVHLENRCPHSVSCEVKTDVNPKPETVKLAPKEEKTVLTFRGSPSRIFAAQVHCVAR